MTGNTSVSEREFIISCTGEGHLLPVPSLGDPILIIIVIHRNSVQITVVLLRRGFPAVWYLSPGEFPATVSVRLHDV